MANTVGTLNLLQSIVDHGLELEKFDTAGTSEEYGNVREAVAHHHDFDDAGSLILHERSPINPKSIYATSKVAADFLTMNYHDAFGVPGVVTRMFNNYGPRQNPRYVTGTIITQALEREEIELGQLDPLRDFCFCTDGVRGHLTVAAHGIPGDVYVYGQGENISMADWADLILRVGEEQRLLAGGPPRRLHRRPLPARRERGDGAARRLREAEPRDRLGAEASPGRRASSARSAGTPRTATAGSAASTGSSRRRPRHERPRHGRRRASSARTSSSGWRSAATTSSSPGATDYDLTHERDARRLFADADPSSSSTSPPRSAGSAPTAPTRPATGTRTCRWA